MIAVLLADPRPPSRGLLRRALELQKDLAVVGEAKDEAELLRLCFKVRPDVVLLDADLGPGAAAVTERLMTEAPVPVLVLDEAKGSAGAFEALRLGAVDVVARPGSAELDAKTAQQLARAVRAAAGVRVVRRHSAPGASASARASAKSGLGVLAIGASTGGPQALAQILTALPPDFGVPVLVVQHMVDEFIGQFASWLGSVVRLEVKQAQDREALVAGRVYLGTGGHLAVDPSGRVRIVDQPPLGGHRPAVDVLFSSLAGCDFARRVGVLLTGMGEDGAKGLRQLRDSGGYCLAQDEASSVVYGMPRAAAERKAADEVVALEDIAPRLVSLFATPAGPAWPGVPARP